MNNKNFEIIETNKNLSWNKEGRKPYCTNNFGTIDEFLTKLVNPENLNNEEWYKVNNIQHDIFNIKYNNQIYHDCTMSNGRVIYVYRW